MKNQLFHQALQSDPKMEKNNKQIIFILFYIYLSNDLYQLSTVVLFLIIFVEPFNFHIF